MPCDLETICHKCLEKDPAARYASADALAEDLRHFLAGEPIQARPTSRWERGVKWAKRRPAVVVAAAASTAAVLSLIVLMAVLWRTIVRQPVGGQPGEVPDLPPAPEVKAKQPDKVPFMPTAPPRRLARAAR